MSEVALLFVRLVLKPLVTVSGRLGLLMPVIEELVSLILEIVPSGSVAHTVRVLISLMAELAVLMSITLVLVSIAMGLVSIALMLVDSVLLLSAELVLASLMLVL